MKKGCDFFGPSPTRRAPRAVHFNVRSLCHTSAAEERRPSGSQDPGDPLGWGLAADTSPGGRQLHALTTEDHPPPRLRREACRSRTATGHCRDIVPRADRPAASCLGRGVFRRGRGALSPHPRHQGKGARRIRPRSSSSTNALFVDDPRPSSHPGTRRAPLPYGPRPHHLFFSAVYRPLAAIPRLASPFHPQGREPLRQCLSPHVFGPQGSPLPGESSGRRRLRDGTIHESSNFSLRKNRS